MTHVTSQEYDDKIDTQEGFCVICNSWVEDVPPQATTLDRPCPHCNMVSGIMGISAALFMGFVKIQEEN